MSLKSKADALMRTPILCRELAEGIVKSLQGNHRLPSIQFCLHKYTTPVSKSWTKSYPSFQSHLLLLDKNLVTTGTVDPVNAYL